MNYLLSKAYICLILQYTKKSEQLYEEFFHKYTPEFENLIDSVKMYCIFASGKKFERPYVNFLMGLLFYRIDYQYNKAIDSFNKVKEMVQPNSYLFKRSDYYIKLIQKINK